MTTAILLIITLTIIALLILLLRIRQRKRAQAEARHARQHEIEKLQTQRDNIEALIAQNAHIYRQYILHTEVTIKEIEELPLESLTKTEIDQIDENLRSAKASLKELHAREIAERQYYEERLNQIDGSLEAIKIESSPHARRE